MEVKALPLILAVAEDFLDSELESGSADTFETAALLEEIFRVSGLDEWGTVSSEEWRTGLVEPGFEM